MLNYQHSGSKVNCSTGILFEGRRRDGERQLM